MRKFSWKNAPKENAARCSKMEWAPPVSQKDHANFLLRLEEQRLDEILNDVSWMKRLRHDYKQLRVFKNVLKHVLAIRKMDLEQEILKRVMPVAPKMSPAGGLWDEEDDQKCAGDDASLESSSEGSLHDLRTRRMQFFNQSSP